MIASAIGAAVLTLAGTGVASASTQHNGNCETHELCLFYNSNVTRSFHDFNSPVGNFSGYTFLSSGSGRGSTVKNNAASARNKAVLCNARIYYNSNYSGAYDSIKDGTWANLSNTYNNNASFDWPGITC